MKKEQKFIPKMTGYKATNANRQCTPPNAPPFQFELGKWYEHKGEMELCKSGFHFCVHPSGPYSFYSDPETRIFKVECENVLEVPTEAGADFKLCAKRIRLVEEITPGKKGNNKSNTGNWNTGDRNTGHWNTGDRNTGNWNTTNYSAGFFCANEPKVISFDVQTNLTRKQFLDKYPEASRLGELLMEPDPIDAAIFKKLPGITKAKLKKLHSAHLAARKKTP